MKKKTWIRRMPAGDYRTEEMGVLYQTEFLEKSLKKSWTGMASKRKARCLIALAYSCSQVFAEELAEQYLSEAIALCPDYFKTHLKEDIKDPDFKKVAKALSVDFPDLFGKIK